MIKTPLYRLTQLEQELNIDTVLLKDEGKRFGLKSFKPLGAFYAITTMKHKPNVLCTMTDGNHGKGVAYVAKTLGIKAIIYVPNNMVQSRKQAMIDLGADVITVDGSYDDAIEVVRERAANNGWCLVSDTSWKGYTDIPQKISIGYSTIFSEITEQKINNKPITHVIIQAGVGGLAGSFGLWLLYNRFELKSNVWAKNIKFIIVEPKDADCIAYNVMMNNNSRLKYDLQNCIGETNSIMAGLNCGIPSDISWDIIKDTADLFVVIGDEYAKRAMRKLRSYNIISGESGAASIACLIALKDKGVFDTDSVVLTINTEADTDPENYLKIINNV